MLRHTFYLVIADSVIVACTFYFDTLSTTSTTKRKASVNDKQQSLGSFHTCKVLQKFPFLSDIRRRRTYFLQGWQSKQLSV